MQENRVIEFYKKMGLYTEKLFKMIKDNTILIDYYDSIFCGVFIKEDGSFRLVLPKISSVFDELVWVHEYAHAIFLDEDEIFPNIMESYFINMYIEDKEPIIKRIQEEIDNSVSENHTLSKKIKLLLIK